MRFPWRMSTLLPGLALVVSACSSSDEPKFKPPVYTLTPLWQSVGQPSLIQAYFSVTDKDRQGVDTLTAADFDLTEDDAALSPSEAAFTVRKRANQNNLTLPTVLLVDLSKSVTDAGGLENVKAAAQQVVDGMQAQQTIQLMTFADNVQVRAPFTSDRTVLTAAINAITANQGTSTNLYGAVTQGLAAWTDGYSGGATGTLTAGLLIVVTDGDDTAGISTLQQAITARGSKRVMTIAVGGDVNESALQYLGNFGHLKSSDFTALASDIRSAIARIQKLNDSIYFTALCSPKRAGQHTLRIKPTANTDAFMCGKSPTTSSRCSDPTYESCGSFCCPSHTPYFCESAGVCYRTEQLALEGCGGPSCVRCASVNGDKTGPYFEIPFSAAGFTSATCTP